MASRAMALDTNLKLVTLRVITRRLVSTPTSQLPHVVPFLMSSLSTDFGDATGPENQKSQSQNETVLLHKFKSQLTSLLQDKSFEARWAAAVLIKKTIEVGEHDVLQGVAPWVRGLVGILTWNDPHTTKVICIITLTRIFQLTQKYQSLVREVTTPSLPAFITACLNILKRKSHDQITSTILFALSELISYHPSIFRPFTSQIRPLILPFLAPIVSLSQQEQSTDEVSLEPRIPSMTTSEASRRLFVLLNICAPKNSASQEWLCSFLSTIESSHSVAEKVFQGLNVSVHSSRPQGIASTKPLNLESFPNISAGLERLGGLLHTVQVFLATSFAPSISLPLDSVLELADTMLSITTASIQARESHSNLSSDELSTIYLYLPKIHAAIIGILSLLISRLGSGSAGISHGILELVLWTLEKEKPNYVIRASIYRLVSHLLQLFGYSIGKTISQPISRCIKLCCEDLLPPQTIPTSLGQPSTKPAANGNLKPPADASTKSTRGHQELRASTDVQIAAAHLLSIAPSHLPNGFLSSSLRAQVDRTAILTRNREAMLASVLNPPNAKNGSRAPGSILPLLARSFPDQADVEALIRPRMPVLQIGTEEDYDSDREETEVAQDDIVFDPWANTDDVHKTDPDKIDGGEAPEESATALQRQITPISTASASVPETASEIVQPPQREHSPPFSSPLKRLYEGSDKTIVPEAPVNLFPPKQTLDAEPATKRPRTDNVLDNYDSDSSIPPIDPEPDTDEEIDAGSDGD